MLLPVFFSIVLTLVFSQSPIAQTPDSGEPTRTGSKKAETKSEDSDDETVQRRNVAISLVNSLADEARSFKDQTRRARVQARAADVLWETDPERARELFRRAWDAAEAADAESARLRAEEETRMRASGGPVVMRGGPDLRSEVLRLAAKRDAKLGEQFLKALEEARQKQVEEATADRRRNSGGEMMGASKRLQLARRLAEDGEVERALQFAAPELNKVNIDSIFFLSTLREKNSQLADTAFAGLMSIVVRNPTSDANTVSGLSSYILTPFYYVTFEADGGSNQSRNRPTIEPPPISDNLRMSFLQVAFQIWMQPAPAPDQDHTTSGRTGKYMVIKRLLPVFEQYASEMAANLRAQMTALASYIPEDFQRGENRAVSRGIVPEDVESEPYERMQERLDRAQKSEERDAIYADYAVALADRGDPRARDLVDKIENSELRKQVKAYTDFQWVRSAIRNKDVNEIARLTKSGELTSVQKVWAYTNAARLAAQSERARAVELLESALAEARRISPEEPDRAASLIAVASGFVDLDQVRSWETLSEAVKAANASERFTGEDSRVGARLQTRQMVVMENANAENFDLIAVFRPLAQSDLFRAIQIAKALTGEAPRAIATLSIARSILDRRQPVIAPTINLQ